MSATATTIERITGKLSDQPLLSVQLANGAFLTGVSPSKVTLVR